MCIWVCGCACVCFFFGFFLASLEFGTTFKQSCHQHVTQRGLNHPVGMYELPGLKLSYRRSSFWVKWNGRWKQTTWMGNWALTRKRTRSEGGKTGKRVMEHIFWVCRIEYVVTTTKRERSEERERKILVAGKWKAMGDLNWDNSMS